MYRILLILLPAVLLAPAATFAQANPEPPAGKKIVPLASNPIKLTIDREGLYVIRGTDLVGKGIGLTGLNPATLGLSENGKPVPILVSSTGKTFGENDTVEFYAHPADNTYASTDVYVLSDAVTNPARAQVQQAGGAAGAATSAPASYVDRQRTVHWLAAPGIPAYTTSTSWPTTGDRHWFEVDLFMSQTAPSASASTQFLLHGVNGSGDCSISVPVSGLPEPASVPEPAHTLTLTLTDAQGAVHTLPGSPFVWHSSGPGLPASTTAKSTFPCAWLIDNDSNGRANMLTYSSTIAKSTTYEEVFPQSFSLTYGRNLCAVRDQLDWQTSDSGQYAPAGFSSPSIHIWRVGSSGASVLTGLQPAAATGHTCQTARYGVSFSAPAAPGDRFYASSAPLKPAAIAPLNRTNLLSGKARLLIITQPVFTSTLKPLVAFHTNRRTTVKVVNVGALYDHYTNGEVNPKAIRTYIDVARRKMGTKFVLLVGGDTYDVHNYFNCPISKLCGTTNPRNQSFVPTLYTPSDLSGLQPSDNLLTVPPGTAMHIPAVALGRMPVVTTKELKAVIAKTLAWPRRARSVHTALFSADSGDPIFHPTSDRLAQLVKGRLSLTKLYLEGKNPHDSKLRTTFLRDFHRGPLVVNYVGHGNLSQWSHFPLFTVSQAGSVGNTGKPALVFQWGCQTSDFTEPRGGNIDEQLLRSSGGAVATVGSTGLDAAMPQSVLAGGTTQTGRKGVHYFLGYLTRGLSIGAALQSAKADLMAKHGNDSQYTDVVDSYEVFGDPLLTFTGTSA